MKLTDRIFWVGSGAVGLSAEGDCHTYAAAGEESLALIDCGMHPEPSAILENIERDGLSLSKLRYCFLTHAHYDHDGGCQALRRRGVQIAGHPLADSVLRSGAARVYDLRGAGDWLHCWENVPVSQLDILLRDGESFDLGGVTLTALYTPGHSPDSVCYLLEERATGRRDLFSGDTVFYKGFISVLSPALNDLAHYPLGIHKLAGLGAEGLFPGHLMWVLRGGQQYVEIADRAFGACQMPIQKPFS